MNSVIWVVMLVAAVVILGGGLALRLRPRHGAQIVLATAYLRAFRTTNDKKESLRRALTLLPNRPPFADLRDEDITFLAELFEGCRHPPGRLGPGRPPRREPEVATAFTRSRCPSRLRRGGKEGRRPTDIVNAPFTPFSFFLSSSKKRNRRPGRQPFCAEHNMHTTFCRALRAPADDRARRRV